MATPPDSPAQTVSMKTVAIATGVAAVIAGVVAIAIVLPAEYGIDPLGTGAALGLAGLADANDSALENSDEAYRHQSIEFVLEPFQSIEYKYHLKEGERMSYAWKATSEIEYDMHAEPHDMVSEADVPTYDKGTAASAQGTYHAEFTGIHGWFWENQSFEEVVLTVDAAGFFTATTLFRDGGAFEQEVPARLE
jgi:hypothetical protein